MSKAVQVAKAFAGSGGGRLPVSSPSGTVVLCDVQRRVYDGVECVEVVVEGGAGPAPHFRVFNPPELVSDPSGDVDVAGKRYRRDPLAALAELIAVHRGTGTVKR